MKNMLLATAFWTAPLGALAGDVTVSDAYVPLAPPGVMAHAAYFELENTADIARSLIGVKAPGYAMAHLHESREQDGVATMSAIHQLDIAPGQSVAFEPGGLHVMLMKPKAMLLEGEIVPLVLEFANGETLDVTATVKSRDPGS